MRTGPKGGAKVIFQGALYHHRADSHNLNSKGARPAIPDWAADPAQR